MKNSKALKKRQIMINNKKEVNILQSKNKDIYQ